MNEHTCSTTRSHGEREKEKLNARTATSVKESSRSCAQKPLGRKKAQIGMKIGRLTITGIHGKTKWHETIVECLCDCGVDCLKVFKVMARGDAISCGCYGIESRKSRRIHGLSKSRTYSCWRNMLNRCFYRKSRSFSNYGGRGITVCDTWRTFDGFIKDMGQCPDGLTIDRIDNAKGYFKENCRWATRIQQGQNRRVVKRIEHQGQLFTLRQLSELTGIKAHTIYARLFCYNWSIKAALCPI